MEAELKRTFRPELLNRIEEIIIFDPLTKDQIKQIVDLLMADVHGRLADRQVTVELSEEAKDWLADQGFDPIYGARPLRRTIQRQVENPLAKRILAGEFQEGDHVVVAVEGEHLTFATQEKVAAMAS